MSPLPETATPRPRPPAAGRVNAFRCAGRGLRDTFRTERNLRFHALAAGVAAVLGAVLGIDRTEWALVLLCVGLVVGAECLNAAVERLADRVTMDHDPLIGRAKDAAAGGVLVAALAAAGVGLLVFGPRVWALVWVADRAGGAG